MYRGTHLHHVLAGILLDTCCDQQHTTNPAAPYPGCLTCIPVHAAVFASASAAAIVGAVMSPEELWYAAAHAAGSVEAAAALLHDSQLAPAS